MVCRASVSPPNRAALTALKRAATCGNGKTWASRWLPAAHCTSLIQRRRTSDVGFIAWHRNRSASTTNSATGRWSSFRGRLGKSLRQVLVTPEMRAHQAFPQLAVIRHGKMEQFVDDHVITQLSVKSEQVHVEIQIASR